MDLYITCRGEGPLTVVAVAGEIDAHTAEQLRAQLHAVFTAGCHRLIVDLSEVTFMDSTGLGVLIGALKRVREHDGSLHVVCPRPAVLKVLQITGLLGIIPVLPDLPAARTAAG